MLSVPCQAQARIVVAVEDAQSTLSDMEALVGRFASWYTPTVFILAVCLGLYKGLQQFLVVIVAGCPCALLGAAPFVQASTLTLLAGRHRLLVKHANTLEALSHVTTLGFDKTGTLTTGAFEMRQFEVLRGTEYTREELHRWVAAVEEQDNHPIAKSLVGSYKGCVADFVASGERLPNVTGYKRHGRHGVSATVEGRRVGVGDVNFLRAFFTSEGADDEDDEEDPDMPPRMRKALRVRREKEKAEKVAALARARAEGTVPAPTPLPDQAVEALRVAEQMVLAAERSGNLLVVIVDGVVAAILLLDDTVKAEAAETVRKLRQLGVRPLLLTGDCDAAARRVAKAVGIDEADVHAALLPEDKQRHILAHTWPDAGASAGSEAMERSLTGGPAPQSDLEASMLPKLRRGPRAVAFVGDGLNDCPALASAHVGVVLQEVGSQATVDAASAVLQVGIDQLPAAITIARRARSLILSNLLLALGINVGVLGLAATVGLPLWLSVLSDTGGLLVVLANSLWPLTWRVGADADSTMADRVGTLAAGSMSSSSPTNQGDSPRHSPRRSAAGWPWALPSVRALTTTLVLSSAWTVAQLAGAHVANSTSLMSDGLAMLGDDSSYLFNLVAELQGEDGRVIKLGAPIFSVTILTIVSGISFSRALNTLSGGDHAAADEDVDGRIVLGFGGVNLLVDLMMLGAILFRSTSTAVSREQSGWRSSVGELIPICHVSPRTEINLFSCLSHVLADTLRSLTQVVVGTAIVMGSPSEMLDAYGTLAICGIIVLGTMFLLWEVIKQCASEETVRLHERK